jgi:glutathione S-transferase
MEYMGFFCILAGRDGRSKGACPFCQDVFLKLLIKREADNDFSFDVITINCKNPPKEFKEISKKLPTLVHGDIVLNDVDDIEDYLDSSFPNSKLSLKDPEAFKIQSNVFTRFTYLIKDVTNNPQLLLDELEKINSFLQRRRTKYMCGNQITGLDCSLWPKLQHIRVAADYILRLTIPTDFSALWRYLGAAYELDAFVKSCPSDQEIVLHWIRRETSPKEYLQLTKEEPRFSLYIPQID